MKITIVGVGALGSHVAQFLRETKGEMHVIDFDKVESKNTMSQFHGKTSVGKNKAQQLAQTMNFLWGKKIGTTPHKLTADNAFQLLGDSNLIIDCLDNAASRRVIKDFVQQVAADSSRVDSKIDCLHGALDANGSYGRVIWTERFKIDEEGADGAATCEDGRHLPFIVLTAATIARAVQLFVASGRKTNFHVQPGGVTAV